MSSIYDKLNTQNSLTDLRCLADITDKGRMWDAQHVGYNVGFTAQEWAQAYPSIPAEKVFARKTVLFPPSLLYYDENKSICLELGIYGTEALEKEESILKRITLMEQDYRDHNYTSLLLRGISEGSGRVAMHLLANLLHSEEPSENLYDAFLQTYSFTDCGSELLTSDSDTLSLLMECKSDKQKAATAKAMKDLPDTIKIYRGQGSKSTRSSDAISWTTDIRKAFFFACWRGPEQNAKIIHAKAKKSDVIEYITDRDESEIIVAPDRVFDKSFFTLTEVDEWCGLLNSISDGKAAKAVNDLEKTVKKTYDRFPKIDHHDMQHTVRVTLLARTIFVANYGSLTAKTEPYASLLEKLTEACIWHDSGRTDSLRSQTHGTESVKKYKEAHNGLCDDIIAFLMTYHCKSDKEAKEYFEKTFSAERDSQLIWICLQIIKDADALDRWRFGSLSRDFVDPTQLRLVTSKRMMSIAAWLQMSNLS